MHNTVHRTMFWVHFLLTDLMSSEYKYFNKIVKAVLFRLCCFNIHALATSCNSPISLFTHPLLRYSTPKKIQLNEAMISCANALLEGFLKICLSMLFARKLMQMSSKRKEERNCKYSQRCWFLEILS